MSRPRGGAHHFRSSVEVFALALVGGWALRTALYFRPTPYGGPYVVDPVKYYFHALLYGAWGSLLLVAPILLVWLVFWKRNVARCLAGCLHGGSIALLAAALIGDHFDHETQRFMGVHATPSFIATYRHVGASRDTVVDAIASDAGGAWLSLLLWLIIPSVFVGASVWRLRRRRDRADPSWRWYWAAGGLAVALAVPAVAFASPGGKFRIRRVEPYALRLWREPWQLDAARPPEQMDELVELSRAHWARATEDRSWDFSEPDYPYVRTPSVPAASRLDRNVILIQLETFRGLDVGHLNPERGPSATPYLDQLVASGTSYARALSFGPPTVNAFIGVHCSIPPHTDVNISVQLAHISLRCLPQTLRERGWHTLFFTGNDPDWDGERVWLTRWYDEDHFCAEAAEDDRVTFQKAADRIIEFGRTGEPFLATLVSATNHAPFRSRDPSLDVNQGASASERILNTVHYTDAVLRDLFERLRHEPWFSHTLVVLYGDHGWNLGEHPNSPAGQRNGYVESVWVPLLFVGEEWPKVPGLSSTPASLLDVAPTVADWLGVVEANPWRGVSLLEPVGTERTIVVRRGSSNVIAFGADAQFSYARNPDSGEGELFLASDAHQRNDVGESHPEVVRRFNELSDGLPELHDYLLQSNRIWMPATR